MNQPRSVLPEQPGSQSSEPAEGMRDEKARARARLGSVINNKWRLDSLLGVGGMASVFASTHRNGSRAAIKIMHTEFARDSNIRERFLREGYVANRIDHPGRVAILDDDVTPEDEPFLVMELLEGETAQQLWRRKDRRLSPEEALWIASEVLATLEIFHSEGIIHRDLKPANIFITKENVVKLLDFGVARMRGAPGEVTRAGTALGTPSFMAPEQARGVADEVDGRADLFSVGATLYALLSGQRLHQARSDSESFILAATQPAPSLARIAPFVPIEVIRIVDKALSWSPRNRYSSAASMRKDVMRVLEAIRSGVTLRQAGSVAAMRAVEEQGSGPATNDKPSAAIEAAAPDDPAVLRLVEVFRRVGELLKHARRRGWEHASTDSALNRAFQVIVEALREGPSAVCWRVRPYAFLHRRQVVWEPAPPLDAVPYYLFAAGVRGIDLAPGITEDELRELCVIMLLDPARDLSPEDDLASVLWEKRLEHVRFDVLDEFAEGDGADLATFYEEADDLESIARGAGQAGLDQMEAAAMSIETDPAALLAARQAASVLALDPVAKKALGAQLTQSAERWKERFADALADAFGQARRQGDPELVTTSLATSAQERLRAGAFSAVFAMAEALLKAVDAAAPKSNASELRSELARGMFTPDTVRLLVWEAVGTGAQPGALGFAPGSQPGGVDTAPGASGASTAPATASMGTPPAPAAPTIRSVEGEEPPVTAGAAGRSAESMLSGAPRTSSLPVASGRGSSPGSGGGSMPPSTSPPGRSSASPSAPLTEGAGPPSSSFLRSSIDLNAIARGLAPILAELGPSHLEAVLDVIGSTGKDPLRKVLLAYIERSLPGHEEIVLGRIRTLDMEIVRPLLKALAASRTPAVQKGLRKLAQASAEPRLRCEIVASLAGSPEETRDELLKLAEGPLPDLRIAALRALVGNDIRSAASRLGRRAQDSTFHALPDNERRELLSTLYSLDPENAEVIAIEILQKHGLLADDDVEQTRALVAELLGERARSEDALAAVLSATKRRWWNSQALRDKALGAAEAIAARLGRRISASGEVL